MTKIYVFFSLSRALKIVQNEEYLPDSDFDEIRIIHRQGVAALENYNKWTVDNVLENVAQNSEHKTVRRSKRQIFPQIVTSTDSIYGYNSTDSGMFGFINCERFPDCLVYPILLVGVLGLILSQPYPGNIPIDGPQPGKYYFIHS